MGGGLGAVRRSNSGWGGDVVKPGLSLPALHIGLATQLCSAVTLMGDRTMVAIGGRPPTLPRMWPQTMLPGFGSPCLCYTLPNDTSNMLTNYTVSEAICFLGSIYLYVPSSPFLECIFFCNDNSLFCPHAHLSVLPLCMSVTSSICLYVFLVHHFIRFSYFSVSEGMGVEKPFFFHFISFFSM